MHQARTKSSVVVIVGTQIDKMKFGATVKANFTKSITGLYSDEQTYPPIKAIKFVSCEERYQSSIKDLRDTLYDIASETKLIIGKLTYCLMHAHTQFIRTHNLYACAHTHTIYTRAHTHTHTHTHTYTHMCTHTRTHIHMHTYTNTHT